MPDARRVVGVTVAVLVVAAVPTLLRNAVQRLDDPNGVPGMASYIDRVTLDVTVVVVQNGRAWWEGEEVGGGEGGGVGGRRRNGGGGGEVG